MHILCFYYSFALASIQYAAMTHLSDQVRCVFAGIIQKLWTT